PEADGTIRFEDRSIAPGARYGYRAGLVEQGTEVFSTEHWVNVPVHSAFALRATWPNPATDELFVSFLAPGREPVSLDLIDVAGRVVRTRRVEPAAGERTLDLGSVKGLAAGLYFVRLSRGADRASAKVVIAKDR